MTNLGLSFGLIIALFIPGLILLLALTSKVYGINAYSAHSIDQLITLFKESNLPVLVLSGSISFAIGLILDGLRYVSTWFVQLFIGSQIDTTHCNEDDRKYFDWIVEHTFRYHQFYANSFLSIFLAFLILGSVISSYFLYVLVGSCIICLFAAILSYKKALESLEKRFNKTKGA